MQQANKLSSKHIFVELINGTDMVECMSIFTWAYSSKIK